MSKEEMIVEYVEGMSIQNPTQKVYHQSDRLRKVHTVRVCGSHAERDLKWVTRMKRTIHFINRTGKLPERFVKDKNEIELYYTMRLVCEKEEYFLGKYPETANELLGLIKKNLGARWKSVDNLYLLRDYLYDNKKRPTQKDNPVLYKTLYNLEHDKSCQWIKKKYKKTVQHVLRLAKEYED